MDPILQPPQATAKNRVAVPIPRVSPTPAKPTAAAATSASTNPEHKPAVGTPQNATAASVPSKPAAVAISVSSDDSSDSDSDSSDSSADDADAVTSNHSGALARRAAGVPPRVAGSDEPTQADVGDTTTNDDFCNLCGKAGSLLVCDVCPRSYHELCLIVHNGKNKAILEKFPKNIDFECRHLKLRCTGRKMPKQRMEELHSQTSAKPTTKQR